RAMFLLCAVCFCLDEVRLQPRTVNAFRGGNPEPSGYSRQDVDGSNLGFDHMGFDCRGSLIRSLYDQGNVRSGVVEENSMSVLVMFSQTFSVVPHYNNERMVVASHLF